MFRRVLITVSVLILGGWSLGLAEFPLEELWSIELPSQSTCLGPHWEEDGQTFFLIGLADRVVIVSESEIVWEDGDLEGPVTSVNRIDFGVGDGPELMVTTMDETRGYLSRYSGEDYEDRIDYASGWFEVIDIFEWPLESHYDRRFINFILPRQTTPDSVKSIWVLNGSTSAETRHGDESNREYTSGESVSVSSDGNDYYPYEYFGYPYSVEKTNNENQQQYIVGFSEWGYYENNDGWSSSRRCGIGILGNEPRSILLTDYRGTGVRHPETNFVGVTLAEYQDEENIFAVYVDTSYQASLARLSIDSLEIEAVLHPLPDVGTTFTLSNYQWQDYENSSNALLCISQNGQIIHIDVDEFSVIDVYDMGISHVATNVDNFDEDNDQELAWLSPSRFYVFDVAPLSEETHSQPYIPESYSIQAAYPNPLNSQAMIEYTLPRAGRYALVVYDMNGAEITRLADEWRDAGAYRTMWDANGIPSGTYVLNLNTSNLNTTKTINLIK